jgi:hypothetical protein
MMKQVLLAAGVSALLAGASLSAQSPTTQTPPADPTSTQSPSSARASGDTITGCVTVGTDGKSYILTETSAASSSDATTPPSSSATSSSSVASPKTYTLVASGDVDLSKYANHKVEITASKGGMSDSTSSSSAQSAAAGSAPRLHVKAVKDISNTCS